MTARAALAALLALPLAAALAPPSPAAGTTGSVRLDVAPARAGVLRAGDALTVDVAITNRGTASLAAGTLDLAVDPAPPSLTATLAARLSEPSLLSSYTVTSAGSPAVPAGGIRRVRLTARAANAEALLGTAAGARVVTASLRVGGRRTALGSSAVTLADDGVIPALGLGAVVPITAPATANGLVTDRARIAALTAPSGAWTGALEAAEADSDRIVALDPAVPAALRAEGTSAPAETSSALARISSLPNGLLRLPYADTDVGLLAAAGGSHLLQPTSFAGTVPASDFTTRADGGASPAPSATPGTSPRVPAADAIAAVPASARRIAWPTGAPSRRGLELLRASGYATAVLASSAVRDTEERIAAGPLARVGASQALIADSGASALLARASRDDSPAARSALAGLVAVLATGALNGTGRVLLTPERGGEAQPELARSLDTLTALPWIRSTSLAALLEQSTTPSVALRPSAEPSDRVAAAKTLVDGDRRVQQLGRAMGSSGAVVGPVRLATLGLLSSAWRADEPAWRAALPSGRRRAATVLGQVRIPPISDRQSAGGPQTLAVTVTNLLKTPIRVRLEGSPSNGRLKVGEAVDATLAAEQNTSLKLPIEAISNGQVDLTLVLRTPEGAFIGSRTVQVNVDPAWQNIGTAIFTAALVVLFAVGIYRNVQRLRRSRRRQRESRA